MAIYNQSLNSLYKDFSTSERGLSSETASENSLKFGLNNIDKARKISLLSRFFAQFKNIVKKK